MHCFCNQKRHIANYIFNSISSPPGSLDASNLSHHHPPFGSPALSPAGGGGVGPLCSVEDAVTMVPPSLFTWSKPRAVTQASEGPLPPISARPGCFLCLLGDWASHPTSIYTEQLGWQLGQGQSSSVEGTLMCRLQRPVPLSPAARLPRARQHSLTGPL